MTRNPVADNEDLSAVFLNGLSNAHANEGVLAGVTPSIGTGDFDIDTSAGQVRINKTRVSVPSDTVTVSDASGLSTGETRVDLVTVDTAGSVSVTAGTPAADPVAPDIPADEVLICDVVVTDGDTQLTASSINDYRALITNEATALYGDGSDGSITDSVSTNRSGLVQATEYTVDSGATVTVNNEVLIIAAQNSITIDGTIDADGAAANGGTGGGVGGSGTAGGSGTFAPLGTGGAGGAGGNSPALDGGDGGDGDTRSVVPLRDTFEISRSPLRDIDGPAGAGGGGGGGSDNTGADIAGSNGTAPGGGGGGAAADGGTEETGGDGGDGGGFIMLLAPDITISGTLTAEGTDGQDGTATDDQGSGGGGGGSGGVIVIHTPNLTEDSPTYSVAAGAGGAGGNGADVDGGDGAAGAAGAVITGELR